MARHSAHITHNGERFYLGAYPSYEAAAAAQAEEARRIADGTSLIHRIATTVSIQKLSAALRVKPGTLRRWSTEGMPTLRIGGTTRFDVAAAEAWMRARYPLTIAQARQSVIYVARRDSDGAVKIGFTSDIERRMKELRKGVSYQVTFVFGVVGDKLDEGRLHRRFAADALGDEWFRFSPAVEQWLAKVRRVAA